MFTTPMDRECSVDLATSRYQAADLIEASGRAAVGITGASDLKGESGPRFEGRVLPL
jgi:hypothetical protein